MKCLYLLLQYKENNIYGASKERYNTMTTRNRAELGSVTVKGFLTKGISEVEILTGMVRVEIQHKQSV